MTRTILILALGLALGFAAGFFVRGAGSGPDQTSRINSTAQSDGINPLRANSTPSKTNSRDAGQHGSNKPASKDDLSGPREGEDSRDFVARLAANDPRAAIAWVEAKGDRNSWLSTVATEWAKSDPEAAMAWVESLTDVNKKSYALRGVVAGVLETGDVARAMEILDSVPPGRLRDRAMLSAIEAFAKSDVSQAIDLMKDVSDTYVLGESGKAIAETFLERGDTEGFWTLVEDLPFGLVRDQLASEFVELVADRDPKEAIEELTERLDLLDDRVMTSISYRIARAFAKKGDPAEAMAAAPMIPSDRARRYFLQMLGDSWAQREPEMMGEFMVGALNADPVAGFGGVEDYSRTAASLVNRWVQMDEESPFAMIEKVNDPDTRRFLQVEALEQLMGKNPDRASERLEPMLAAGAPDAVELSERLMTYWLRRAPEDASSWLGSQAPGPAKDTAIKVLVENILSVDEDPNAAAAWIGEVQSAEMREKLGRTLEKAVRKEQ